LSGRAPAFTFKKKKENFFNSTIVLRAHPRSVWGVALCGPWASGLVGGRAPLDQGTIGVAASILTTSCADSIWVRAVQFAAMLPTKHEGGTTPELVLPSSKMVGERKGNVSIFFFNELIDLANEGSNLSFFLRLSNSW
jgi:hypothetical protein